MTSQSRVNLQTPCCAVLGHVDVGKTKLLDLMRNTTTDEASGITQQIGTTLYSRERLEKLVGDNLRTKINLDSLLMIDTPGHECFDTIRYVALMVTDVVILMVDMIKGLEKQTIHIISLLQKHNVPYIICLNKMDRIYGWAKPSPKDALNMANVIKRMTKTKIKDRFDDYVRKVQLKLYDYEVNSELYYQNRSPQDTVNIVPISAETGEGVPDLVMLISAMAEKRYLSDKLIDSNLTYGYILDTHYDKSHGKYLVALHRNGTLLRGDVVLIGGREFRVKHILTNSDNREIKDDHKFGRVESVNRSIGLGLLLEPEDTNTNNIDDIEPASMYISKTSFDTVLSVLDLTTLARASTSREEYEQRWGSYLCPSDEPGAQVVAPSYVMMDGLLHMLTFDASDSTMEQNHKLKSQKQNKQEKTQLGQKHSIERYKVGKIDKKDIMMASKWIDRARDQVSKLEAGRYSLILSYDPSLESLPKEVLETAKSFNVVILHSNVVYKLIELYNEHLEEIDRKIERLSKRASATIKVIPKYVFRTSNPMLFGVTVTNGSLKVGQQIFTDEDLSVRIGKIESMQKNKTEVTFADTNDEVCIKVDTTKQIDKDFDREATLWSA
ncbi:PHD finger-like domain-containing protein 5A [Yasminevirus sp. GU-2018]|uniref:PHD finger-like domain-containing protein 5A n=1 Tax=Yasminevirus sp. GU-2018 TaxID=2420051 RepID=A0A5K0U9P9_9VIRU|nr:PHD finger-like domain-containing protein 5A [Yasminevirus sp. GU-2018]